MNKHLSQEMYGMLPTGITGLESLAALALDIRWSWNHEADELWRQLDPALWNLTHNPWIVLQTVSKDQLENLLADTEFSNRINELTRLKALSASEKGWFQQVHGGSPLSCIAYFSMEYMLSEALPIYVGGLGNVAGDQLKSASDLNVPVVAIGLLYGQGYFHQEIDKDGSQLALYPYNDPGQLPVTPLRLPNGEWLRIKVALPGYPVWLRTWQVQAGRCKLYLLDSNDAANLPWHRGITNELYGGDSETRIKQEIILGIGGWKLLQQLNIQPEVCHLNEGHSAFAVLERTASFMKTTGLSFREALSVTRAGNLFTTHTATAAGFDHFSPQLMEQYFSTYANDELHISLHELLALGRQCPANTAENFNMAYLAIRGSGAVNGVSNLHGHVSRQLFQPLFKRWPTNEVPVGAVTNGVHTPSWDSALADAIWTRACGKDRWKGELEALPENILQLDDEAIWQMKTNSRKLLVNYVRERFERQVSVSGQPAIVETAKHVLDDNILTLGFARRFVSYKRPTLLLHDEERLVHLLTNTAQPVQLIIAGKAPPGDEAGKALIKAWVQFIQRYNLYKHVVFLSDYDMLLTEQVVQGVDVWINTPRRPWEACGTSGMKVLVNGGLNLSELDGWWAEAYSPEVGWAIGGMQQQGDDAACDAAEAAALYTILEQQVVPAFYNREINGIPAKWIEKIRNSMAILTPKFSANRTVRQYTEQYYLPAAEKYLKRAACNGAAGKKISALTSELKKNWSGIRMNNVEMTSINRGFICIAGIFLNKINPDTILVELYADEQNANEAERITMQLCSSANDNAVYKGSVQTTRPIDHYTIRIIPNYENVAVPLENDLIWWQR